MVQFSTSFAIFVSWALIPGRDVCCPACAACDHVPRGVESQRGEQLGTQAEMVGGEEVSRSLDTVLRGVSG